MSENRIAELERLLNSEAAARREANRRAEEESQRANNEAAARREANRRAEEESQRANNEAAARREANRRAEEESQRANSKAAALREANRRAEEESQRANNEAAARREANRRAEEESQRANSEAAARREANRRADRESESRRDAEAFAAHIQRQLDDMRSEVVDPQNLRNYLNQIRHLHLYTSRLLPFQSQSSRPLSLGTSNDSNAPTTTSGQTSITKKVYPLRVRQWIEFPQDHDKVFSSLREQLQDSSLFPPRKKVEYLEETMQESIPIAFLKSNWFLNHLRTSAFLNYAVEQPCSKMVAGHFTNAGSKKEVFFDNKTSGVKSIAGPSANVSQGESGDTSSGPDTVDGSDTVAPKPPPRKTMPDCVVLVKDEWIDRSVPKPEPYRLTIGEHKPCHSLRARDFQNNPTLPEDCLIRMAIASKSQVGKGRKGQRVGHQQSDSAVFSPSGSPITLSNIPHKLRFFASALAQTYHYMIMSGLEYGYLATGETLTFLRIPLEDPATLLYYTSFFPAVDPKDLPKSDGDPVYPSHVTASVNQQDVSQVGDDILAELAVSQLCSLCIMASTSAVRPVEWVNDTLELLAEFPNLPKGYSRITTSSLGIRLRNDSDDETGSDDGSDGNSGSRRLAHRSTMHRVHDSHERAASPLWQSHQAPGDNTQHHHTSRNHQPDLAAVGIKAVKEKAMLPYCTQACLLGLVRGLPFDTLCPNYHIHKTALLQSSCAKPQGEHQKHPIHGTDVCRLIQEQIAIHPENNCTLLYNEGLYGAIGCLFKLSINGYGYTFVAKGVESHNARRLKRETRIYSHLRQQQGTLIPVHLGLVKLHSPYPFMAKFTTLSHLMLMSYTGKALHYGPSLDQQSQELGRDLNQEVEDTYQKLQDWGLNDRDHDVCNATWCEETQSVMKIDFDHCVLDMDVYEAKLKAIEGCLGGSGATRKRSMGAVASAIRLLGYQWVLRCSYQQLDMESWADMFDGTSSSTTWDEMTFMTLYFTQSVDELLGTSLVDVAA
ncbi:hypothetical protein HOO65_050491 [Ceratocystis lukuohia]|uniref:BRCT domain-containing protein n=1 Tax=Ceratocystis lukuohia TaxID=2019550 RepID=A0ABR4MGF5_9PEZI